MIDRAVAAGSTYSRDYRMKTGAVLVTHYFNDDEAEVALYNHPTKTFMRFDPPKKWIQSALDRLEPRTDL